MSKRRHESVEDEAYTRDENTERVSQKDAQDANKKASGKKRQKLARQFEKAKKHQSSRDRAAVSSPEDSIPQAIVIRRGRTSKVVNDLVADLRLVMAPWCARKLRETKQNRVKDFVSVASTFGVAHLLMVSQTDNGVYLRIASMPAGPTLTFQVDEFSLRRDIWGTQPCPRTTLSDFAHTPVVVLNGFTDISAAIAKQHSAEEMQKNRSGEHKERNTANGAANSQEEKENKDRNVDYGIPIKLMSTVLRRMFPAIDASQTRLSLVKRVVLFNFDPESRTVEWRQYGIKRISGSGGTNSTPSSVIRNLLHQVNKPKKLPDLSEVRDVGDYILGLTRTANCDVTDPFESMNEPGAKAGKKRPITLTELGPRLKIRLIKAEEEVCTGAVLFHEYISKSPEELKGLAERGKRLRKKRVKEQKHMDEVVEKHISKLTKSKSERNQSEAEGEEADEAGAPGDGNMLNKDSPSTAGPRLSRKQRRLAKKKAITRSQMRRKGATKVIGEKSRGGVKNKIKRPG